VCGSEQSFFPLFALFFLSEGLIRDSTVDHSLPSEHVFCQDIKGIIARD
jgi:hypothetical protein